MKTVEAGQFAADVNRYLQDSISEIIIVTQAGRPCAVVHGLEYDEEQMELVNSREFWSMIEERRKSPTISWKEAKRRLESLDQPARKSVGNG
jgi:hypothetical protein